MQGVRINTVDLLDAAVELARDHDLHYAESCVKAVLREKMISLHQYWQVMKLLYGS